MKKRDIVERLEEGCSRIVLLAPYAGNYEEMLVDLKDIFQECSDEIKYLRRKLEEQSK